MKYVYLTLFCFICFALGAEMQKHLISKRVFTVFGEGDYGYSINEYLITGDTTEIENL